MDRTVPRMRKKTLQYRLAESIDLVEKLRGIGVDTKLDEMKGFVRDMNSFVREGKQSDGEIHLSEACILQYRWRVRGQSVIQSKKKRPQPKKRVEPIEPIEEQEEEEEAST
jgi:hypothetical protein